MSEQHPEHDATGPLQDATGPDAVDPQPANRSEPDADRDTQAPTGEDDDEAAHHADSPDTTGRVIDPSDPPEDDLMEMPRERTAKLQELVDQPAKVMRIGTMIRQLLEEVRNAPLDDAARSRLAEIHERSIKELEDGLAPELVDELHRINLPFSEDDAPSDAELRVAQAQLVGWLEGLFHGIQTALAAQQMANQNLAARIQLRQLPPGTVVAPGVVIGDDGEPRREASHGMRPEASDEPLPRPGQYL